MVNAIWTRTYRYRHTIEIPGLSQVIAEGDVAAYIQDNYQSRCGYTGTLGETEIQEEIQTVLAAKQSIIMLRAKRKAPKGANWQRHRKDDESTTEVYTRAYRFPPRYEPTRDGHDALLLKVIKGSQTNEHSTVVFFNTITECNAMFDYLIKQGIDSSQIQILDDTNDENADAASLRPSEATVIDRANAKNMITLTTAAGSRGSDFSKVNVGIVATPSSKRVVDQKAGRIGRNGEFGVVYEIYCTKDVSTSSPEPQSKAIDSTDYRSTIARWEKEKQTHDLETIKTRAPLRAFKQYLQKAFFSFKKRGG